jgi:hypothetical protein
MTWIGLLVVVVIAVGLCWLYDRRLKRQHRENVIELTAQRRATLDSNKSKDTGGSPPPGAKVAPLSLHKRNGRRVEDRG